MEKPDPNFHDDEDNFHWQKFLYTLNDNKTGNVFGKLQLL